MSIRKIIQCAAASQGGTGGGTDGTIYVDDVFSSTLYTGTSAAQTINTGVNITGSPTNKTVLHITGDSIYDYAPIPNTFTLNGNLAVNTTTKQFGTGSLSFDGTGDYLTASYNSQLNVGSSDFTLEFWMYVNVLPTAWKRVFSIMNPAIAVAADEGLIIEISNTNKVAAVFTSGSTAYNITDPTALVATTWTHWAMVKSATTMTLYKNGTSVGSVTIPSGTAVNFSSLFQLYLGRWPGDVARDFNGYIDDLRLINGAAMYTGNFTPPTAALPLDTLSGGGLVWIKNRSVLGSHLLFDTVRGADALLQTNQTNGSTSSVNYMTGFTNTGLTLTGSVVSNETTREYVAWSFRREPKFFDIVTWIGDGNVYPGNRTISHSLGAIPGMMIIKVTSATDDWIVWHSAAPTPGSKWLRLNTTDAQISGTIVDLVTATNFRITDQVAYGGDSLNQLNQRYIAYIFGHDTATTGKIQCGSYTATGSINLGWEPQFILTRCVTTTANWKLNDNLRGITGSNSANLSANTNAIEENTTMNLTLDATGFTVNTLQDGAGTYIYLAIRRPNKTPTSGTQVFRPVTWTGTGTKQQINAGFAPDACLAINRNKSATTSTWLFDSLRGANTQLYTDSTSVEQSDTGKVFNSTGLSNNSGNLNSSFGGSTYVGQFFKRAPGFFDIVCDTGNGSTLKTTPHNLGVVPELIIRKPRSEANSWWVYHSSLANINSYLILQSTQAQASDAVSALWGGTLPTSSNFYVGYGSTNYDNKSTITYVNYLFATLPGISKVGSYTGNGSVQTINCGFTAGARFILIKCISAVGDWYIWDSARGIIAANEPHLSLNTTAAEVATDDSIDPDNTGFIVNQVAATNINVSSATYIFLAIA